MKFRSIRRSQKRQHGPSSTLVGLGLALLLCLGQISAVHAANGLPTIKELTQDASNSNFAPQSRVSLKQATAIARKHTGGRVLSANTKQRGAQVEYRVRMLVNGERVVTVTVDQAGQVRDRR
ncbi:MAG: PepSY domain-containing protein [Pseudomonadota bacterium]